MGWLALSCVSELAYPIYHRKMSVNHRFLMITQVLCQLSGEAVRGIHVNLESI